MSIKVLIVDDSLFFCRRVVEILKGASGIEVCGVANNGREAIEKAQALKPDVITLDVEMPIMDGVTALREIVKVCDARVLMLSSLTYENAKTTLDALEAGATDFLLKSYESLSANNSGLIVQLQNKIRELGKAQRVKPNAMPPPAKPPVSQQRSTVSTDKVVNLKVQPRATPVRAEKGIRLKNKIKIVVIGASTGGPVALQKILSPLPANFPYPITVTQHMPGTFTGAFASRLNGLCQLKVVEAQDNMPIQAGHVYIAPGGKQMVLEGSATRSNIRIRPTDPRLQFSPSVDVTFGSASKIYNGEILALILTGMGSDGTEGCRLIKAKGGHVLAQDSASCVVYGMPMSVTKAGLSDFEIPLEQFSRILIEQI